MTTTSASPAGLPGRPDPERPIGTGRGTRASGPPTRDDIGAARAAEEAPQPSSPAASVYAANSTPPACSTSSKPSGENSSKVARAPRRARGGPRPHAAEPAQRNASSASRRSPRRPIGLLVARCARTPRAAGAARLRRRGTATLTSTRWSPRPKPWSTGMSLPAQDAHLAGLHAVRGTRARPSRRASRPSLSCRAPLRRSSGRPTVEVVALPHEARSGLTRTRTNASPARPPAEPE